MVAPPPDPEPIPEEEPTLKRLTLHDILVEMVSEGYAYFQPPESLGLSYPCIIYKRDKIDSDYANNRTYANKTRYIITTIDPDPDAQWQYALLDLPLCKHVRNFITDGLNHDIFELYY